MLSKCSHHNPGAQVPQVGQQLRWQRFQNSWELPKVPLAELGLSAGRPYLLFFLSGVDV